MKSNFTSYETEKRDKMNAEAQKSTNALSDFGKKLQAFFHAIAGRVFEHNLVIFAQSSQKNDGLQQSEKLVL